MRAIYFVLSRFFHSTVRMNLTRQTSLGVKCRQKKRGVGKGCHIVLAVIFLAKVAGQEDRIEDIHHAIMIKVAYYGQSELGDNADPV